jgi:hypothetical protein
MLRTIFEPKSKEVGSGRLLCNEEFHNLCNCLVLLGQEMKEVTVDWMCNTSGKIRNVFRI